MYFLHMQNVPFVPLMGKFPFVSWLGKVAKTISDEALEWNINKINNHPTSQWNYGQRPPQIFRCQVSTPKGHPFSFNDGDESRHFNVPWMQFRQHSWWTYENWTKKSPRTEEPLCIRSCVQVFNVMWISTKGLVLFEADLYRPPSLQVDSWYS